MLMIENDFFKARSAAFALATSWEHNMKEAGSKTCARLNEMRKTCIDVICQTGYADKQVYDSLKKSYSNNLISANPDFDEIRKALDALAAINSDEAVNLLYQFLLELHQKKCTGTWKDTENTVYPWIINCLAIVKPKGRNVWNILISICQSGDYSAEERLSARDVLVKMKETMG